MSKKQNYIVGLDIGTTKICCIIAEVTPQGEIEIIGLGQSPPEACARESWSISTAPSNRSEARSRKQS